MKKVKLSTLLMAVSFYAFSQLTTGYLPRTTSNVSITGLGNSAAYQTGNLIGIGTTSPASTLAVKTNVAVTNAVGEFTNDYFGVPLLSNTTPYTLLIDRYITKTPGPGYNVIKDLTVNNTGLVGVGVSNAASHLDVSDQNNDGLSLLNVTPYGSSSALFVGNTGNVGIGTSSPTNRLDVAGNVSITGSLRTNNSDIYFRGGSDVNHGLGFYDNVGQSKVFAATSVNGPVLYGYGAGALGTTVSAQKISLLWNSSGLIQIPGTLRVGPTAANSTYAGYRLSVDGDVIAKKVVVQTTNWADKVFSKNYQLPTLNEVENYVNENHHLPLIPTECEVLEKGVDVGQMNTLLLQKVEELTLYMIEMKKENESIKAQLFNLKK